MIDERVLRVGEPACAARARLSRRRTTARPRRRRLARATRDETLAQPARPAARRRPARPRCSRRSSATALAAAALRPVESMRREAEAVSATEPGRRLTLPPRETRSAGSARRSTDARPAGVGARARAALRRRREPRAANPAGACSAPSSSSRCAASARPRSWSTRSGPRRRRRSGSPALPKTCSCSRASEDGELPVRRERARGERARCRVARALPPSCERRGPRDRRRRQTGT